MDAVTMRLPVPGRAPLRARVEAVAWQLGAAIAVGLTVGVLCAAAVARVAPSAAAVRVAARSLEESADGPLTARADAAAAARLAAARPGAPSVTAAPRAPAVTAAPRGPAVAAAAFADEESAALTGELHGSVYAPGAHPGLAARLATLDDDAEVAQAPVEASGGFTISGVPAGCYALGFARPDAPPLRLDPEAGRVCIPEGSGTFISVVLAP
jgi:hypothetical protein